MNNIENFRNLMNHQQQQIELDKQQKEQADRIKSEENMTVLNELGLPYLLQSIIDENIVPHETEELLKINIYPNTNNSVITLECNSKNRYLELFKAVVTKNKTVLVITSISDGYDGMTTIGKTINQLNLAEIVFDSITKKTPNVSEWTEFSFSDINS